MTTSKDPAPMKETLLTVMSEEEVKELEEALHEIDSDHKKSVDNIMDKKWDPKTWTDEMGEF